MKPKRVEKNKKASCRPTPNNWHKMNRKQRREMTRKIQSEDLSLEVVHPDAAGIDIGNESHYVAVPPTRDSQPVRRFGCTTSELKEMSVWLKQCAIRTIALQSTGVYWIAVYDILEQAGFEVYLVNANQTKNLPGRKSDVQESQWLMKLHTYGLLRNSFRPSQEIRTMRTYWRQRNDLVRAAGRHIQRMQKALTQMNIQLANVLSDVSGMTGQAIIGNRRSPHKTKIPLRDKPPTLVLISCDPLKEGSEISCDKYMLYTISCEKSLFSSDKGHHASKARRHPWRAGYKRCRFCTVTAFPSAAPPYRDCLTAQRSRQRTVDRSKSQQR